MLIGYARVSTQDQTLDLQTDALKQAGCEKLFTDMISGGKSERPGLQDAMNHLSPRYAQRDDSKQTKRNLTICARKQKSGKVVGSFNIIAFPATFSV
jgi:DNA invertase Pin-like site-specific DNA recombinase